MNSLAKKIKMLMIEKDITGADIARIAGVSRSAISHIIAGHSKSQRLRQLIAKEIGVPVEVFWPGASSSNRRSANSRNLSKMV